VIGWDFIIAKAVELPPLISGVHPDRQR
jgi:hypothetical protein